MSVLESRFSTAGLAARESDARWRETIGALFDVTPSPRRSSQPVSTMRSFNYGELVLTRCDTFGQRFQRTAQRLSTDPIDHYLVQYYLRGGSALKRNGATVEVKAGEVVIHDLADRHDAHNDDSFSNLTFIVPRQALAPRLDAPDSQTANRLNPQSPLTGMLTAQMKTLFAAGTDIPANALPGLNESLLSLMATAINAGSAGTPCRKLAQAREVAAVVRVKDVIERNLDAPDLDVGTLAALSGVSRSKLYRLFRPYGGVYAYLKERRLKAAAKLLGCAAAPDLKIYQVALACGFKSEAHFSRAFKAAYGARPRDAKADPGWLGLLHRPVGADDGAQARWASWLTDLG